MSRALTSYLVVSVVAFGSLWPRSALACSVCFLAEEETRWAFIVTTGLLTLLPIAEIVRRHPEVARARLVVEGEAGNDRMTLKCEVAQRPSGLAEAIVASIRDVTKLRGSVQLCVPGTLPNDGKVIEDARRLD